MCLLGYLFCRVVDMDPVIPHWRPLPPVQRVPPPALPQARPVPLRGKHKPGACTRVPKDTCAYNSAPPVQFIKLLTLIFWRKILALCPLDKCSCFSLSSADFFQDQLFWKDHLSVKQIGSRSGQTFCWYDLGQICLQRLSADDTQ